MPGNKWEWGEINFLAFLPPNKLTVRSAAAQIIAANFTAFSEKSSITLFFNLSF